VDVGPGPWSAQPGTAPGSGLTVTFVPDRRDLELLVRELYRHGRSRARRRERLIGWCFLGLAAAAALLAAVSSRDRAVSLVVSVVFGVLGVVLGLDAVTARVAARRIRRQRTDDTAALTVSIDASGLRWITEGEEHALAWALVRPELTDQCLLFLVRDGAGALRIPHRVLGGDVERWYAAAQRLKGGTG